MRIAIVLQLLFVAILGALLPGFSHANKERDEEKKKPSEDARDGIDVAQQQPSPPQDDAPASLSQQIGDIKTTTAYSGDGNLMIQSPSGTSADDLLFLFLSRTDGPLPLAMYGWTRLAECFKSENQQDRCFTYNDCSDIRVVGESTAYCDEFEDGTTGEDLATVVFYRKATDGGEEEYSFSMEGDTESWAIMASIGGIDASDPVRDVGAVSCDQNSDSVFPSVEGNEGDILLLHMANDDAVEQDLFGPPPGTTVLAYTSGEDETGILYGKQLTASGSTGELKTEGDGSNVCRDALISLTLRRS